MSGFIAIINTNSAPCEREVLEELTASLYFRGPDMLKAWIHGPVGLGHALLKSTTEARFENQPASLDPMVAARTVELVMLAVWAVDHRGQPAVQGLALKCLHQTR